MSAARDLYQIDCLIVLKLVARLTDRLYIGAHEATWRRPDGTPGLTHLSLVHEGRILNRRHMLHEMQAGDTRWVIEGPETGVIHSDNISEALDIIFERRDEPLTGHERLGIIAALRAFSPDENELLRSFRQDGTSLENHP